MKNPFRFKQFQLQDYARAALHDGLILSHDTGLGKSIAAIVWPLLKVGFEAVREPDQPARIRPKAPILIVSPGDLHDQQIAEAWDKFRVRIFPMDSQETFQRLTRRLQTAQSFLDEQGRPILAPDFYITSYSQLTTNGVERLPDAFVLVDRDLKVMTANAAFVDLAEAASADRLTGQWLGNWLGRPGIDLELIISQMREHSLVRNVSTIVRGAAGALEDVEVSGVISSVEGKDCFALTIRSVARRLRDGPPEIGALPRSVDQLTELVGRVSLKEIVRESTDLIERLCIEAALTFTSDNRASAAEILGVSRQSLYSKLHRYGLATPAQTGED